VAGGRARLDANLPPPRRRVQSTTRMPDEICLEWTYDPADLFEERAERLVVGCPFVIDAGSVSCRVPFEGDPAAAGVLWSFCNAVHERLNAVFLAAQALQHKA